MKIKTTRKELNNMSRNIYQIGYCGSQYLFMGIYPQYYNSGIYGWNFDGYRITEQVNNEYMTFIFTTGYRNMTGKDINKLAREYDNKARTIYENYNITYTERLSGIEKVRTEFLTVLANQ